MLMTIAPLTRGLFHRAISESGSSIRAQPKDYVRPDAVVTLAQAEAAGERYVAQFGVASIDALRRVPASEMVDRLIPGAVAYLRLRLKRGVSNSAERAGSTPQRRPVWHQNRR